MAAAVAAAQAGIGHVSRVTWIVLAMLVVAAATVVALVAGSGGTSNSTAHIYGDHVSAAGHAAPAHWFEG